VHHRDTEQGLDVDVVRMRFERIPEEDDHVDPALGDRRPDLLIPTQRSGEETVDRQSQFVCDHRSGGAGAEEIVARQCVAVEARPFEHVRLLVVMCDQHDLLSFGA
jgi:hypothetical protein